MASFSKRNLPIITNENDTVSFSVDKIKIDIFNKNLFGSATDEIVMQLRQENIYFVNVFYKKDGKLFKVPNFISHLANIYTGYFNENFIFYFENIAQPNVHSIITKSRYFYNYHWEEEITMWDIQPDSIREVYSTLVSDHTSSAGWHRFHSTKRTLNFQDDSFPKSLFIQQETVNFDDMEITQEGDTISGTKTTQTGPIKVIFDYDESGLKIQKIDNKTVETKKELKRRK